MNKNEKFWHNNIAENETPLNERTKYHIYIERERELETFHLSTENKSQHSMSY